MGDDNSRESIVRLEENQSNLIISVNKLSKCIMKFTESNYKIESKIDSLEIRAINRLDAIEEKARIESKQLDDLRSVVHAIEIERANQTGKDEAYDKVKSIIWNNWFKIFSVVVIFIPVVVTIYNMSVEKQPVVKMTQSKKKEDE